MLRPRSLACLAVALSALALSACGNTVQDTPIGSSPFEYVLLESRFPVYWDGLRYDGIEATSVGEDRGGAITIEYGDCLVGGQYTCMTPLTIVTSPDNGFTPGGSAATRQIALRGVPAIATEGGKTLIVRTGGVVVSVYASRPSLALSAARTMTPLNAPGLSGAPLPPGAADTGFERLPLPAQVPRGLSVSRLPSQIGLLG